MTETIGQKLLQARTQRGLSLDEAARATRIRSHFLKALEADDLAALPSPAQFRGFLRLYADYLGIDPSELNPVAPAPKATVKATTIRAKSKLQDVRKVAETAPLPPALTQPAPETPVAETLPVVNSATTIPVDENIAPPVTSEEIETVPVEAGAAIDKSTSTAATAAPVPVKKSFLRLPGKKAVKPASPEKLPKTPNRMLLEDDDEEELTQKTSQEMIVEIGHTLRKQREMLNLSIEEVEHFTRLRLHHIKALESGRMEDLASPVQARGMLSNYARFLNLDDEKILLAFADALQVRRLERLQTHPGQKSEAKTVSGPGLRRFLSLDLVLGSIIVLGMFGFLIWGISRVVDNQKLATVQPTLPSVADILSVSPTATPGPATPIGLAQNQTPDASGGQSAQPTDAANAGSQPTPAAQTGNQTGGAGQTPIPNGASAPTGPIQVYVVARNSAWMRVLEDGKEVFIGRVIPGNAYTYAANKQLEVISGNAAALQILYNQNDLGSLGVVDQVIDLIFTTKGLVAPTATITPTPTKVLTPTPGPTQNGTVESAGTETPVAPAPTQPNKTSTPANRQKPSVTPTY